MAAAESKGDEWGADDTLKSGFLHVAQGGKGWKKRFMLVDQVSQSLAVYQSNPRNTLYKYKVTESPLFTIKLVGTEIHKNDTAKGAPVQGCCWDVVSPGDAAPQRFCAKDAAEYDEWTTFIQEAIDGVVQAGRKKPTLGIMKSMRPSVGSQARHYEDWVLKTGPDGRTWNLRWAVLDPTCKALLYYENDQKKKVKGIVDLRGVELKVGMEGNPMRDVPAFSITGEIGGVPRGITFCTPSVEAMQNWIDALNPCISQAAFVLASERLEPARQGWLQKADPKGRRFKKRFCKFDPSTRTITYHENETAEPKGTINLRGATVSTGIKGISTPTVFVLVIRTVEPERTWYLCAENERDLMRWRDTAYSAVVAPDDATAPSHAPALTGYASSRGVGGASGGAGGTSAE